MNLESNQEQAPLELVQVMFASTVVFVVNFFGFLWFVWSVMLLSHSGTLDHSYDWYCPYFDMCIKVQRDVLISR